MNNSYTLVKPAIKQEVQEHINAYKSGTDKQKKLSTNLQAYFNTIHCFQCLDTKQAWYFRGNEYKDDGKGEYYVMTCAVCSDQDVKDKWIKDSLTNELEGVSGIKLFNKENYSGAERFAEIVKRTQLVYPEVEAPIYNKSDKTSLVIKKKVFNLKLEVGNIVDTCAKVLKSYCGDVLSLGSLISNISVNISNCENDNKQEKILCEEIDRTKFIYVKITNSSTTKKKSILGIYSYNKYKLDLDIYISVIKPSNESAYTECANIVSKLASNEINEVKKLFLAIDFNALDA